MAKTSDERREVAATLRDAKRKCDERGYPWMTDDLCLAIGYEHDYEADNGIFDRFADLIDPTCEMEPMPACVPHHRFSRWRCRKCGIVSFTPSNATSPSYCPYCGHRWVTRDDQ